ncbi:hypothetical protein TCAL_17145 [Tigriopus californicus]|uniref:Uncharacterized protein n=1 Tax=Tigriopus californicus TaxID=6832 RepID=A0A553P2U4_TIGCA|nr:hypothetical protein TCAL_17145 [Tigriopus californicus]
MIFDFSQDPLEDITDVNGRIESAKLDVWMTKNEIDPMDPKNQDLMDRVLEAGKSNVDRPDSNDRNESSNSGSGYAPTLQGGGHFRLDDYHDQFLLGTSSAIENNPRFQMLKLRSSQVAEFKNYRMIPINDKEIPRGIFESLKKPSLGSKQGLLDTEPLRQKFKTYLEQLREEVNHNFAIARHKKRHCDVINEVPLPTSGTMAMLFGEMVPAQRPLKPYRFPRPKIILLDGQDLKILISVVRAFDVPVRNDMDPLQSNPSLQGKNHREESIHGMKENLVRSFVEVRFQGQCQKTPVAPGPNPAWNEEIEFTFKSPNNDFSSDTLNRIKDNLHLHLFDEVAVDMLEDEEERPREVHQRFERKWLGSLAIPFVTMYRNTRIEGTFKLHSPPVLLGYERTGQTSMASGFWRENTDMDQPPKEATYLSIYLTINPPLSNPEPIKEKLECEEDDNLVRHCEKWHRDLMSKFPNRVFSPMVADLTGKSVLVTRYFRAIRPPHDVLENNDQNPEKVAWFVALIPYLPRNALFPGIQAIWPTCEQFIKMMVGSEVEHAVLMTNYFTSLGKKAYLVLGQGIPEGQTAYVLTAEESGQHWLWNVVTGEHFNTSETFCPLVGVTAVANESNVWGNVQSSDAPNRMKWDLTNGSDWTPLFGSHLTLPDLSSVQPTQLSTSQPDQRAATTLKDKIEKKIKSHISSLRKRLKLGTPLNFTVAASLKRLLPALESNRGGIAEGRILATEHLAELKSASAAYKICGFPLHFGYSHMDQIVEALEATGVHLNREPGVEFAVAVHVEPFPQTVMSVWIYVASLVRRR